MVEPRWKTGGKSPQRRRRDAADRAYEQWRDGQLKARPWCETCPELTAADGGTSMLPARSSQIHHRRLVKQGGVRCLAANTLAVCTRCHRWIHANPTAARRRRMLVSVRDPEFSQLGAAA